MERYRYKYRLTVPKYNALSTIDQFMSSCSWYAYRYKLNVPKYNALSTIDNCLNVHTGRFFSTFDYDNDGNTGKNCAEESKGGWWYNNCAFLDPTIPFTAPGQLNTTCTYKMQAKKVPLHGPSLQMKIRPTVCDQSVKSVYMNGYTCQNHNL